MLAPRQRVELCLLVLETSVLPLVRDKNGADCQIRTDDAITQPDYKTGAFNHSAKSAIIGGACQIRTDVILIKSQV